MDANEIGNQAPESAENAPKQVRGRPFTKENAAKMALSAAAAKKRRREARMKMLSALTSELDLGDELVKAMKQKDEGYLGMIMTATKLVGLQHDQSDEALIQRIQVDAKSQVNAKTDNTLHVTIEEATGERKA